MKNRPDYCGSCLCDQRSILCCKGKLALKDFRKLLAKKYIPFITSSPYNIIIISIFFIFLPFNICCIARLDIEFNTNGFLKEGGLMENAPALDEKYFTD